MKQALRHLVLTLAATFAASCGIETNGMPTAETEIPCEKQIGLLEKEAANRLGLKSPVELVEFRVDQALQSGRLVDSDGKEVSFCWDGRWSMRGIVNPEDKTQLRVRELEEGFYLGDCPPKPSSQHLEEERAIVVLAAVSVRRQLTPGEVARIGNYQREHQGLYSHEPIPVGWASRLLAIGEVNRYSVANQILTCGP
jgi:hypothetical protein